jgi:hypothetical protein
MATESPEGKAEYQRSGLVQYLFCDMRTVFNYLSGTFATQGKKKYKYFYPYPASSEE